MATVYMKNDRRALLCITEDSSISKRRSVSWNKITKKKKATIEHIKHFHKKKGK